MDDLTDEEVSLFQAQNVAADFALRCRLLCEAGYSVSDFALSSLINTLMAELWGQGFSQTEIRSAFGSAASDVSRFAGDEEQRGAVTPLGRRRD